MGGTHFEGVAIGGHGSVVNVLSLFPCGRTCGRLEEDCELEGFKYEEEAGSQEREVQEERERKFPAVSSRASGPLQA